MAVASPPFTGFSPEAIQFLADLAVNNDRAWFQPRKADYERLLKEPLESLVAALAERFEARGIPLQADPKRSPFRIYRDTRFSKDKTPYKTHIAAVFHRRGMEKETGGGLYFAVSHKEVEVAGGIYMPAPETLLAVRTHVARNHETFRELIQDRGLRRVLGPMQGEQLTRVPKGFDAEHPAADLLRYKQFLFYVLLDPQVAAGRSLEREVVKRFRAMMPFLEFLNAPLAAAVKKKQQMERLHRS